MKTVKRVAKAPVKESVAMSQITEEGEEESESGEEEVDSDNDNFGDRKKKEAVGSRPREETAEEKRLRKQSVKEERKARRSSKKEVKTAFRQEGNRLSHLASKEQSTDRVSVFKYSN